jgi:hypothetical protein
MTRRSQEREWPCIKCGAVDGESYMIAIFAEEEGGDANPPAWIHRRCWRTYRATLRGMVFVDFLTSSERAGQDD